jgi:hypothetical protein
MQVMSDDIDENKVITVCNKCLRACCFQGAFMCALALEAGTVRRTVKQLRALPEYNREHEDYWRDEP